MLISFCTKSGDAELCPVAEDNSLSPYICGCSSSGPILPSWWTDYLLHTRETVVGNALPDPSGVAPPE